MEDLLVAMLNALGDGAQGQIDGLLKTPQQYNPGLYQAALAIHNGAVKPIAAIVLAIIAVLMLSEVSTRVDGDRELGVKLVASAMFKIALVLIAAQQAFLILDAINAVAVSVSQNANTVPVGPAPGGGVRLGDSLKAKIVEGGAIKQLGLLLVLFIPWLLAEVVAVIGVVLVFARFLQLYLMTAFASLPMAFFGHSETKSMGIGYLKRYATAALQGTMLVLCFKFYQALMGSWLGQNVHYDGKADVFGFITSNFGHLMVGPLVLAFMLFGASSLAKAIVGEG